MELINWRLVSAPLNFVTVTVLTGFAFLALAVIFPELFIPANVRKA